MSAIAAVLGVLKRLPSFRCFVAVDIGQTSLSLTLEAKRI